MSVDTTSKLNFKIIQNPEQISEISKLGKQKRKILSIWKPHTPVEFHMGHAWFLKFLLYANESDDTDLKIIIAPPLGLTRMSPGPISENANLTKLLIREYLERNDHVSNVTTVTEELISNIEFEKFKNAYFSLRQSKDTVIQNFIKEKDWAQRPEFPAFLASAISSQGTSYIISGEKHGEVWWFFEQLFKNANLPFPKLLNVISFPTYILNSDQTVRSISFPMTSKSNIRIPLIEESLNIFQTVTSFVGMAPQSAFNNLCQIMNIAINSTRDDLATSIVKIGSPISEVLAKVAPTIHRHITAERIDNKTILQQMYGEEIISDPTLISKIEEARNGDDNINKHPAEYREMYRLSIDHMARRIFKNHGAGGNEVKTLIEHSQLIDPLLYLSHKRYRDHYMHQLNVALLGGFLLRCEVKVNKTLSEYIVEKNPYIKSEDELFDAWWIAALLHDHAYPLAYLSQALQDIHQLATITGAPRFRSIGDAFINYVELLTAGPIRDVFKEFAKNGEDGNRNDQKNLENYGEMVEELAKIVAKDKNQRLDTDIQTRIKGNLFDHGVISALNLFLKTKDLTDITNPIVQASAHSCLAAVQAIAMHNLPDLRLSISKYPLAALLCLSDELQEWGRQFKTKTGWDYAIEALVLELEQVSQGLWRFTDELSIEFICSGLEARKITEWDYKIFESGKSAGLHKINFDWDSDLKPQKLSYSVRIPVN